MSEAAERATIRKVTWRLLPILMVAFFIAYIDRLNVSVAGLQMREDIEGFGAAAFGFGAGIFFIAYFIFEVPSNLILERVGARRWISRIMLTWGIITVATIFVNSPWQFYVVRFLLGAAEAGFYPGVILYLTYWFPARERGRSFSWFQVAVPITLGLGAIIAGSLLTLDGLAGLQGWQWVFLVTGAVAILYTAVVFFFLTDTPDQADWLTPEERNWLTGRIRAENEQKESRGNHSLRAAFSNGWVWFLSLLYFAIILGQWGIGFWLPQIVSNQFAGTSDFQASLLTAVPWLVALVAIVPVSMHSDRTGERRWHAAIPCFVSAVGFALSVYLGSLGMPYLALAALALATTGIMAAVPVFWNLPAAFLTGAAAASGIALINSLGNLSGFVGPYLLGIITEATGSTQGGLLVLSGSLLVAAVLALLMRHDPTLEQSGEEIPEQSREEALERSVRLGQEER